MQINKTLRLLLFGSIIGLVFFGADSAPAQDTKIVRSAQESYKLGVESFELFQQEKKPKQKYLSEKAVSYMLDAYKYFNESYKVISDHPGTLYFLMLVNAEMRDPKEAKKFGDEALSAKPSLTKSFKDGVKKIMTWAEKEIEILEALTGREDSPISAPPNVAVPEVTSWSWKK